MTEFKQAWKLSSYPKWLLSKWWLTLVGVAKFFRDTQEKPFLEALAIFAGLLALFYLVYLIFVFKDRKYITARDYLKKTGATWA